jgi:hypothetical protein
MGRTSWSDQVRIWGRVFALNADGSRQNPQPAGFPYWQIVQSDPVTGDDSWVRITQLCQTLLLNLGESPFYSSWGLPAKQTIVQQVQPDFYINRTQAQFAQYFANLAISKLASDPPTYQIAATLFSGAKASVTVTIPQ